MFKVLSRPLNIYFIVITLLSAMDGSPKNPFLNFLTVSVIFTLLISNEVGDGIKLIQQDVRINQNNAWVYSYGNLGFEAKTWGDVKVGDIVLVWNEEELPADLLIINSNSHQAYFDMNRIDGEMVITEKLPVANEIGSGQIQFLKGIVYTEMPNANLQTWRGMIEYNGNRKNISQRNMGLRGSILRSTEFIMGIVIYVGHQSKALKSPFRPT